jgi:HEPN domain-containing protein
MTDALAAHNFFFSRVCDEGVVLYSRCQAPLIHREEEQINALLCTQRLDVAAIKLARAFLEGASFFSSQGCNRIALFMLHQAMEHSCISLVRCMTGYRPSTHNLRRLLAMTENVSVAYSAIFPSNTAEEKDLFSILARAYSEARYKEDFAADCRTVKILIERVTLFQSCAEKFVTRTVGGLTSSRAS